MGLKDVALMYDFDGTLAKGNMQEYGLISDLDMECSDFWRESSNLAKGNNMDVVLSYLYLILEKAKMLNISVNKDMLIKYGENIPFYNGVIEWFDKINEYGASLGLNVHHYVISSGMAEVIQGTKIADKFDKIFACSYMYDKYGTAKWPALCVNYTNKTQFLYRISKGFLNVYDSRVNDYVKEEDMKIPFSNMIYLGDGETDVPCMKIVKNMGGKSIMVYDSLKAKETVNKMLEEGRINFYSKADYSENNELFNYTKKCLNEIASKVNKDED